MPPIDPVSATLGISSAGPLHLMAAVSGGLPLAALDHLTRAIAPTDSRFAFRIVPRPTLARRRKTESIAPDRAEARLSAEEGARLARVAAVWALALDVWKSEAEARRFMFDAHPLLGARAPIDVVLQSELGRPIVEDLLGRLRYGSAV